MNLSRKVSVVSALCLSFLLILSSCSNPFQDKTTPVLIKAASGSVAEADLPSIEYKGVTDEWRNNYSTRYFIFTFHVTPISRTSTMYYTTDGTTPALNANGTLSGSTRKIEFKTSDAAYDSTNDVWKFTKEIQEINLFNSDNITVKYFTKEEAKKDSTISEYSIPLQPRATYNNITDTLTIKSALDNYWLSVTNYDKPKGDGSVDCTDVVLDGKYWYKSSELRDLFGSSFVTGNIYNMTIDLSRSDIADDLFERHAFNMIRFAYSINPESDPDNIWDDTYSFDWWTNDNIVVRGDVYTVNLYTDYDTYLRSYTVLETIDQWSLWAWLQADREGYYRTSKSFYSNSELTSNLPTKTGFTPEGWYSPNGTKRYDLLTWNFTNGSQIPDGEYDFDLYLRYKLNSNVTTPVTLGTSFLATLDNLKDLKAKNGNAALNIAVKNITSGETNGYADLVYYANYEDDAPEYDNIVFEDVSAGATASKSLYVSDLISWMESYNKKLLCIDLYDDDFEFASTPSVTFPSTNYPKARTDDLFTQTDLSVLTINARRYEWVADDNDYRPLAGEKVTLEFVAYSDTVPSPTTDAYIQIVDHNDNVLAKTNFAPTQSTADEEYSVTLTLTGTAPSTDPEDFVLQFISPDDNSYTLSFDAFRIKYNDTYVYRVGGGSIATSSSSNANFVIPSAEVNFPASNTIYTILADTSAYVTAVTDATRYKIVVELDQTYDDVFLYSYNTARDPNERWNFSSGRSASWIIEDDTTSPDNETVSFALIYDKTIYDNTADSTIPTTITINKMYIREIIDDGTGSYNDGSIVETLYLPDPNGTPVTLSNEVELLQLNPNGYAFYDLSSAGVTNPKSVTVVFKNPDNYSDGKENVSVKSVNAADTTVTRVTPVSQIHDFVTGANGQFKIINNSTTDTALLYIDRIDYEY